LKNKIYYIGGLKGILQLDFAKVNTVNLKKTIKAIYG